MKTKQQNWGLSRATWTTMKGQEKSETQQNLRRLNLAKCQEMWNRSNSYFCWCCYYYSCGVFILIETTIFCMTSVFSRSFDALGKNLFCWLEFDLILFLLFFLRLHLYWILNWKEKNRPHGKRISAGRSLWQLSLGTFPVQYAVPVNGIKWTFVFPCSYVPAPTVCASEIHCYEGNEWAFFPLKMHQHNFV